MTIWRKVSTLFRASAHEPAERLVDANALRILAQELRETEQAMSQARHELAVLMAERKQLERHNTQRQERIVQRESQAEAALGRNEGSLALELAGCIAEDENLLREQQQQAEYLAGQERTLRQSLRDAARTLQHYKGEMQVARANQQATQVTRNLSRHTRGLKANLGDVAQSLERIRDQHSRLADINEAMQEIEQENSGSGLEQRLQRAGISTSGQTPQQVLERLRGKITSST